MGWYYRKSLGIGPFRLNLSGRRVGFSVGGRGCGCGCLLALLVLLALIIFVATRFL